MNNIITKKSLLYISDLFLDTLFPKDLEIIEIEKQSIDKLINRRKSMPTLSNKHCFAFLPYQDADIKKAIFEIKYRKNKVLSEKFAKLIYKSINPLETNPIKYTLIPIPPSKKRLRTYGYSQTLLIAKYLIKINPEKFTLYTDLKYKSYKSEQKHKNRQERLSDNLNIFTIENPTKIENKYVMILDDIITSGSTCSSAINTIKACKAKYVIAIAITH